MGLLSVLSIDHNRKGRKQLKNFTTRDRHEHLSRSDGVWIKKEESEFLGRGHNGMRKGLGPRKRRRGEKGRTEEGKRMNLKNDRMQKLKGMEWGRATVVNMTYFFSFHERLSGIWMYMIYG